MNLGILLFLVAGAVFISMVAVTFSLILPQIKARANLRQRISVASGNVSAAEVTRGIGGDSSRRRDIQSRLRQLEDAKTKKSFAVKLRETLRQAGLRLTLRNYFLLCTAFTVVAAILYKMTGYHLVGIVPVSITVGFGLPRYVLFYLTKRRVNKFTKEFANAVDIIVRGIKSGLPVSECLKIIATESPEPVAGLFLEIVESQNLGLTLEVSLERAQEQIKTPELQFFTIVLIIQGQTGGNLADTLANLSGILRDRKKMADKVKSLSSEAKSSAGIIGSLPFLMTGLLYLVNPEYLTPLFTADLGKIMIAGGLVWMSAGIFIMKQMINFEF
tara:strand:+ start:890 stop:1879 length:990 start_codon:yes stop_codon:yes gene_type:complete